MLLRSSFAAKACGDDSARGGRNEELEKRYQNGFFGGRGDPKRPPIPSPGAFGMVRRPRTLTLALSQGERGWRCE
jgi:hypothetical protein